VKVSVILPVHDGAAFLAVALESVFAQTMRDFELIVVDDGSTDATPEILGSVRDPRLRVLRNETRRGIAPSLNRALDHCRGDFVARADADDVNLPERFARQLAFLDAHPRAGVCGTWIRMFDGEWTRDRLLETDPERMRCSLVLYNVLSHPTAMWRRAWFERHGLRYDETLQNSEDFELWCRASLCFELGNVPEVLLRYRVHPGQVGTTQRTARLAEGSRIRRAHLARLGIVLNNEEQAFHDAIAMGESADMRVAGSWLRTINRGARGVLRRVLIEELLVAAARQSPLRALARAARAPDVAATVVWRAVTGRIDDRRRAATPSARSS
jgi:glycosyltransferase involved in cell wall biosynthesis